MSTVINSADSFSPATSSGLYYPGDVYNSSSISLSSITIQNIASMVPTNLNRQNYNNWRSLFTPVLKRYKIFGLVNGDDVCPPECIFDSSGSRVPNPAYEI